MKATVTVMLKDGVLDPQGEAVRYALGSLGFEAVNREAGGRPAYHPAALLKIYI